jgi:hypothetical protein
MKGDQFIEYDHDSLEQERFLPSHPGHRRFKSRIPKMRNTPKLPRPVEDLSVREVDPELKDEYDKLKEKARVMLERRAQRGEDYWLVSDRKLVLDFMLEGIKIGIKKY